MIAICNANSVDFSVCDFGYLSDDIKSTVIEELNGDFTLEIEYPVDGIHFGDIQLRRILVCKPNPYDNPQPFRIYEISKPINKIVTIRAEHLSYDLAGFTVKTFESVGVKDALTKLKANIVGDCKFTFETDKTNTANMSTEIPKSVRECMSTNVRRIFKGDWYFDGYVVHLKDRRGNSGAGVTIRYGKNLTDFKQDENCQNMYTAIFPYWAGMEFGENDTTGKQVIVTLPENTLPVPGTFNYDRIRTVDLSDKFNDKPSVEDLRKAGNDFIADSNMKAPKVSFDVSFVQLSRTTEYSEYAHLERIGLGDQVTVEFLEIGISAEARCINTEYDVKNDKYIKIGLGDAKATAGGSIVAGINEVRGEVENVANKQVRFDLTVGSLQVGMANIEKAIIGKADIEWANINFAKIINGIIDVAQIGEASIESAKIKDLDAKIIKAGTITADKIASGTITSGSGIIADASIGSAQISDLSATKLTAGVINTYLIELAGENGRLKFKNNTITANDGTRDRAVFGLIGPDKYGLQIRNENGSILLDDNGLTQGGWSDGYNKQPNSSVDPGKLDINKVVTNINGASTKILATAVTVEDGLLSTKITSIDESLTNINNELVNLGQIYTIILDRLVFPIPTSTTFIPITDMTLVTKVRVFDSTSEIFDFSLSQAARNQGIDITFDNTNKTVTATIKAGREIEESATLDINITIDSSTFSRTLSFVAIPQGSDGAPARVGNIIRSSEFFYTADGGKTFTPDSISLTPVLQNVTFTRWQYSTNANDWTNVTIGQNGINVDSNGVLTIVNTSNLYSNSNTVWFKLITGDSDVFDITTVSKLFVMDNDVYTNITTNTASIKQLQDEIKLTVKHDDYTKDQNEVTSRFETAEAKIQANADKIALSVTKTEFDNLTLGGRNLIFNSTFNNGIWENKVGFTVLSPEEDRPESCMLRYDNTTSNIMDNPKKWTASYKKDDEICISFDYRPVNARAATVDGTLFSLSYFPTPEDEDVLFSINKTLGGLILPLTVGTWYRVKYKFKFAVDLKGPFTITLYAATSGNNRIIQDIREINVENGSKIRDWTPAPEDWQIRMASAEIKLEPGKIVQAVSDTLNDGSGKIVTATYEFTQNGGRYKHSATNTYTDLDSEGMGIYTDDGKMVASYRSEAHVPRQYSSYIYTKDFDCPVVGKTTWTSATVYVSPGGSGDRTGRNESNCCQSVDEALRILCNGANHLNGRCGIVVKNGVYEGAIHDIHIADLHGKEPLEIRLEQDVTYHGRFAIENCTKYVSILSTAVTNSNIRGALIYPLWVTPCIDVNRSYVKVEGLMLKVNNTDSDDALGVRAMKGATVEVANCDFNLVRAAMGAYNPNTKIFAWDTRGSNMHYIGLVVDTAHIDYGWKVPQSNHNGAADEAWVDRFGTFTRHDVSDRIGSLNVSGGSATNSTINASFAPLNVYSTRNYTENGVFYQAAWTTDGPTHGWWRGVAEMGNQVSTFCSGGSNTRITVSFRVQAGSYGYNSNRNVYLVTGPNGANSTFVGSCNKGQDFTSSVLTGGNVFNHLVSGGELMIYSSDASDYLKIEPGSIRINVTTTKAV